jgi:hypothetical protein
MSTVQVRAPKSADEILKAASRLRSGELEKLVTSILALQANRRAPTLPKAETELLLKITNSIPTGLQERYNALIAKRRAQTLAMDDLGITGPGYE